MGTPKTLRERVDSIVEDLSSDTKLFDGVLGGLIEKRAAAETPAKVLEIAAGIEKEIGLEKQAALKMAWQTYTKYVNPGFPMPSNFADAGKEAKGKPPAFVQKMKEQKAKAHAGGKKAEIKKEAFKSPEARLLAEKLGSKLTAEARKELPKSEFAEPDKKKYPIEDKAHARNALARVAQHGSAEEKATVKAKVKAKFPDIGEEKKSQVKTAAGKKLLEGLGLLK